MKFGSWCHVGHDPCEDTSFQEHLLTSELKLQKIIITEASPKKRLRHRGGRFGACCVLGRWKEPKGLTEVRDVMTG